jgi:hypothetical protein
MEVKINLPEEAVDKLLEKKGYVVEKVLVHYKKFRYTREDKWGKFYMPIAYPKDNRPKVLDNETILMTEVQDMNYDKVANHLFNELLLEKVLN